MYQIIENMINEGKQMRLKNNVTGGSYLNQNLENKDIPPGQLMSPTDNPVEVCVPVFLDGQWVVVSFTEGQPYPSSQAFDSAEQATGYAAFLRDPNAED
jgi:hypothetical protein